MSDQSHSLTAAGEGPGVSDILAQLAAFEGAPEEFAAHLLKVQCGACGAEAGALLRPGEKGIGVLALYPMGPRGEQPAWLGRCADVIAPVIQSGRTRVVPLHDTEQMYGQPARRGIIVAAVRTQALSAAVAFVVPMKRGGAMEALAQRVELTEALMVVEEMRRISMHTAEDLQRMRAAMEVLAVVNEQKRFKGAAMALVNEVASRWRAERVGLGFLKGRYVQLKALSHTEKFSRKMQLVQDLESAMEECIDQDVEVVFPSPSEATAISRAAGELSKRHGLNAVACLPIRDKGEPTAVLIIERAHDDPMTLAEIESLRLMCDLVSARVINLEEHDRWFGARAAGATRKGLAALIGPKHTWAKLAVAACIAAIIFLIFARGDYNVKAPFIVEAEHVQLITAPFEGTLEEVMVEPGDEVEKDGVVARINTAELEEREAILLAQVTAHEKEAAAAQRDGKTVEQQIANANAAKVRAELELVKSRLRRAEIRSRIKGTIVKGELKRQINPPVGAGDVLFEVAELGNLRAVINVPEDVIADVIEACDNGPATGELATTADPGRSIPFEVERINKVAEVIDKQNVFKVRVRLLNAEDIKDLKPGMGGTARIYIKEKHYAWIWTRRLINWVRMKLWM